MFSDEEDENSNMFKVDHDSQPYKIKNLEREEKYTHFFNKETQIIKDGERRKVVYGTMERQPQTVFQILQPYLHTMAQTTGNLATVAGKGIYGALSTGAEWIYDKVVNTFIPYTAEQLPKLIFVIKGGKKSNEEYRNYSSDNFHVLEVNEEEFEGIGQRKRSNKTNKKRIIVPLDPNGDPEFAKFLQRENYVPDYSFPIDMDEDDEEDNESFMVPSANFMVLHDEVYERDKMREMEHRMQDLKVVKPEEEEIKNEVKEVNEENEEKDAPIHSMILQEEKRKQTKVEEYKKAPLSKKVFKLKDCFIFELEGKNSIEYDFLDNIERDEKTQSGYLVLPEKVMKSEISEGDEPGSGEVPLMVEKEFVGKKKVVDAVPKVRAEIPTESHKVEAKREVYLA